MRKLSGSLFLRLALLVVISVLVTQIFTWWIVTHERRELIVKHLYSNVLDTLADLEGRLDAVPPQNRMDYLNEYNRPGLIQLRAQDADSGRVFSDNLSHLESAVAERMSKDLGEQVVVKALQNNNYRQLWIRVRVLGTPYWLVVPMGRFQDNVATLIIIASLLACLSAILVASFIAWRTSAPISRVVQASHDLALGRRPQALPENEGPREVRTLSRGFNQMAHALEVSASERRLMLAGLSHDLRTPLTRLKLMVELQENMQDKSGMLSDIDELSGIVRQFIDFARSEEKPRNEPVALAELASSVVARFARENIQIQLSVEAEPEIQADPLALERLMGNLLDNARRYGQAPIEVKISADDRQAILTVTDHGAGIPIELRQAALAPFERLAAHRGTDGGSGLGLAIVSRIVKQHQGTFSFEEVDGGGLSIRIGLPLEMTKPGNEVSRETYA